MSNVSDTIISVSQSDELPLLHIHHPHGSAVVALQGAQVLQYQRADARPLIWLSDQAIYQRGQSLRGGIPVCWPWFGDLARNPQKIRDQFHAEKPPAHGLVRGETWLLDKIETDEESARVVLRHPGNFAHGVEMASIDLQLEVAVGATLRLKLTTSNRSDSEFVFSQALHTYFAVSDIQRVKTLGLENARYIDTLENWAQKTQHGAIEFSGETDRIYLDTPELIRIHDAPWQREIHIRSASSKAAVVWNPWIEKTTRLSQMAPAAWQQMGVRRNGERAGRQRNAAPRRIQQFICRNIGARSLNSSPVASTNPPRARAMRFDFIERMRNQRDGFVELRTRDGQRRCESQHRLVRILGENTVAQQHFADRARIHQQRIELDADEQALAANVAHKRTLHLHQFLQQISPVLR
jgi:glucose-6-phosphate 1-epimerase